MLQSPPTNVYASRESSALVTFITAIGVTYLSLCLVLPTMVVGIFASHFLLTIFLLPLINEPTIGWFSIDLVLGTILVGWLVGSVQAFVLQHVLHMSLRSWNMWIICTTMGWSSALMSAGIAFL